MKALSKVSTSVRGFFLKAAPERLWKRFVAACFLFLLLTGSIFATTFLIVDSADRIRSLQADLSAAAAALDRAAAEPASTESMNEAADTLYESVAMIDHRLAVDPGPTLDALDRFVAPDTFPAGADAAAILESEVQPSVAILLAELSAIANQRHEQAKSVQWLGFAIVIAAVSIIVLTVFLPCHVTLIRLVRAVRDGVAIQRLKASQLRDMEQAFTHADTTDQLTHTLNRSTFLIRLNEALETGPDGLSVLSIDINRFRAINDSSGQAIGDALLVAVAQILKSETTKKDCVARIGSDEFAVITRQRPDELAESLLDHLREPIQVGGRICQTGLSIGIVRCRRGDNDPRTLLSNADLAQQHARSGGINSVSTYSRTLRQEIADRDALAIELPHAIADGQIIPFYQPQIDLTSGEMSGVEILARWRHPDRGLIPPDVFLSLAETAGIARDLDHKIWQQAMRQFTRWATKGVAPPRISLNAAPETIADPQIVPSVLSALKENGLTSGQIAIEVLETTFIGSIYDAAALNIDRLIGAGVLVELDDFGTGYTSLSTLIQLNLSGIKLDRSLISPLPSRSAQSVVRAVMALAKELKLHVVAEGIETPEQAEYLASLGCDIGQGYAIGKPMNAHEFSDWMVAWNTARDPAPRAARA